MSTRPSPTRFRVIHRTRYAYALPVELCHNEAHVKPRSTTLQRCLASRLTIDPAPSAVHERVDYFGNTVSYFAVQLPARELTVVATSEVEVSSRSSWAAILFFSAAVEAALKVL